MRRRKGNAPGAIEKDGLLCSGESRTPQEKQDEKGGGKITSTIETTWKIL